jgi:hypothetical protein
MRAIIGNYPTESTSTDRTRKIESWAQSIPAIRAVWAFADQLAHQPGMEGPLDLEVQLSRSTHRDVVETWTIAWSTILAAALNTKVNLHVVSEPINDNEPAASLQRQAIFQR